MRRLVIVVALLCGSGAARAAGPSTEHFDPFVQKPATSPLGLFTLEGAAAGDGFEWGAARVDYGHGLLALRDANGKTLGDVIPDRFDLHLLASYAYKHFLSLGVDVPVTVYQADGFAVVRNIVGPTFASQYFPKLPSAGLGDIRFVPKIALPFHRPFSLALVPEIRLRTGRDPAFLGDQNGFIKGHAGPILAPRAEAEATVWRLRVVGELGYQVRGQDQYFNLIVGDQFTFGAGAEYALPDVFPNVTSWEVIGEFNGTTQVDKPFTFSSSENYETPLELVGGVRARFVHGWLVYGGVGSGLSGGGYGRELFRAFLAVGWEPPNAESTVPQSADEVDSDHDGVPDGMDKCPTQPGPADTDGCPDTDGDGIPDKDDQCPQDPGPVENQGCPVDVPVVTWKPPKLELNAGINFETGSATIKKESLKVVDAVADFLKQNAVIKKVLVEGHTDNRGTAQLNLDLSKRRAKAVVARLVHDGVDPARLDSEGYGFSRPIASNDTALGRAKNRRVEFTVVDPPAKKETIKKPQDASPKPPEPAKPAPAPAKPAPAPAPIQAPTPAPKPAGK